LIVKPFGITLSNDHIYGVLGGLFAALAYTTIKKIKDIYDTRIIMLSFMSVGFLLPLLLSIFTPYVTFQFYTEPSIWVLLLLMALVSTASQWFLTKAYSLSKGSIIGVVSYSSIPFAVGFGLLLGDSLPDIVTSLGIILVVFGGILVGRNKQ
jgi:drug/metabolite transporter (DMT)-like permease